MTRVRRCVAVIAIVLVTGCGFGAPNGSTRIDAAVDPIDAPVDTPPDTGEPAVWLQPWMFRKPITLRASLIEAPGDGALTDFPVLVSVADPQIRAAALSSGANLVFTAADATTVLASEIESFTPATSDQLVAWVKVPSLSATADTTLYVYYGNPAPPAPTPEAVWTADFLGVWHLHQNPAGGTGSIQDATSSSRDGTAAQMEATDSGQGQIGRGLTFNGSDEYVDFGPLNLGDAFTISMWIEYTGGNNVRSLMANSGLGGDTNGFRFFVNSANPGGADRRIYFETGNGLIGSTRRAFTDVNAINLNAFAHVAVVVNRTAGTAFIYVNGARADTATTIRDDFENNSDFELAQMEGGTLNFPGTLDEIEVAGTLRDPEWLLTSFNNQSQPGNFHALGPEERRP